MTLKYFIFLCKLYCKLGPESRKKLDLLLAGEVLKNDIGLIRLSKFLERVARIGSDTRFAFDALDLIDLIKEI